MPEATSYAYSCALVFHLATLLVDLGFNTLATVFYADDNTELLLYILQDTLIVMSIIALAIMFSSTFVFQAGLIGLLLRRFAPTILVALCYLTLSICLHVFSLRDRWSVERPYKWPGFVVALFLLQRITAIVHYFLYKRTVLMLADPRFHRPSKWLHDKIDERRKQ